MTSPRNDHCYSIYLGRVADFWIHVLERDGEVDEVEVQVIKPKIGESLPTPLLDVILCMKGVPQLTCDEHIYKHILSVTYIISHNIELKHNSDWREEFYIRKKERIKFKIKRVRCKSNIILRLHKELEQPSRLQ